MRGKRKKKDVQNFSFALSEELADLHADLSCGAYRHGAYTHFKINDPKPRDIHKATVRDRLVHHAIHRKLYPFFVRTFLAESFSCQTGKGLHRGLRCFRKMARSVNRNNTRTCWVLKCDVRKFFASVDHVVLMDLLEDRISDRKIIRLLSGVIDSFHALPGRGLPLGNLTSQLFANIYLTELDQYVKHVLHIEHYVRYADDFVFLSDDRGRLVNILRPVQTFLQERLRLDMHPDKIVLKTLASGVDFLGWTHFPHHRLLRTKTKRRMLNCLGRTTDPHVSASYLGLLSYGNTGTLQQQIVNDGWFWNEGGVKHVPKGGAHETRP